MPTYPPPLKQGRKGWPWQPVETAHPEPESYPKISMMVPSYLRGEYIEETLRSIILQGYPNLELIVMDGGSNDGTVDILQYYDSYITYWESKKDKGQSNGINKALEHCTGDIITFQNSDALYLPGTFFRIAAMYNKQPDAGVFAGGFYNMNPDSERISEDIPAFLTTGSPVDLTLGPPNAYRIHQNAVFFSRHAVDAVGRYVREDLDFTMDREWLYRIVKRYSVVLSPETFGAFRKHPESKSTHSIRPFAAEWAALHREFKNGNRQEDIRREAMARFRLYRGEIQYAKLTESRREQRGALLQALRYKPSALFDRAYLSLWYNMIFLKRR